MKQRFMKRSLLLLLALLCLVLTACGKDKPTVEPTEPTDPVQMETVHQEPEETLASEPEETEVVVLLMPWEADGAKQPEEYTLEEYEGLTTDQRKAFRNYLGAAGYAAWLEWAEEDAEPVTIPWNNPGAKQPKDYTWADYQALTEKQKKAFMEHLGAQGLEAWLDKVQNQKEQNPWEISGAKQPNQYTWADYQALTEKQKADFVNYLGAAGFQAWLNRVQGQKEVYPWEKPGAKKAADYTWEEYEALNSSQKKAFRNHLGNAGFEAWLEKVQEEYPWEEDGAKQPEDYTWEEYLALTENQKTAFQEYLGGEGYADWLENALDQDADMPWKKPGAKQPKDYSWADYEALAETQQAAFREYLGEDATMAWLRTLTKIPWEEPKAKQPEDYTLEEYEDLEDPQQLAFRVCLGEEEFEAWLLDAQNPEAVNPWEIPGAKQPKDYTWEEFQALTIAQQMAFQNHLGETGFQAWLDKIQKELNKNPWEFSGAKQPKDYTWAEYEALTAAQQMAFQQYLGAKGFEDWLSKVQEKPVEKPVENPWEKPGAKQPKDYTWAEFEALTAAQQTAFQKYLGADAFNAWLDKVQNQVESNPWDAPGAKQPQDYTWAEFEALTAGQQMAFQKYLGEAGFESWLNRVQNQTEANPWDVPGAKQPQDYTWEEFEALTAGQQMAFQNYLGPDAFDAWLNQALNMGENP